MKILRVLLIIFVLCLSTANGFAYTVEKGEKLEYSASFLHIIPAGDIALEVKDITSYEGKRSFFIVCEAKTAKWMGLLFRADAVLNCYTSAENLYPYKFEQILKIAGRQDDVRRAVYDRSNNVMEAEGKGKRKVPADVRDPLSAIYYLRTQPLKEGARISQMVNSNQSNYIFDSEVAGKKKIGKAACLIIKAKIRRENKSLYHSMDVTIYVTDDAKKLPVLIQAKTKLGPVTLKLRGK